MAQRSVLLVNAGHQTFAPLIAGDIPTLPYDAAGLAAAAAAVSQPLDSDLTALAAIAPSDDDFVQRKSGVWVNRSLAQALTDFQLPAPNRPVLRAGSGLWWPSWTGGFSTLILTQGTQYGTPFYIAETVTCTGIGVIATGVASSSVNLSIYADNGALPDALVNDAGNATTTTTAFAFKAFSQQLVRGWYWLACAVQGAAGSVFCNTSSFIASRDLPVTAPASSAITGGFARTGVAAGAPSPWGATKTETARVPMMFLRF
jgi:hypothetical protein